MIRIKRKKIKKGSSIDKVLAIVKRNHKPAPGTVAILKENREVRNFCEMRAHFAELPGKKTSLYISYEVSSILREDHVMVTIDAITFYDHAQEYQEHRFRALGRYN